jgi:hypothetical protein
MRTSLSSNDRPPNRPLQTDGQPAAEAQVMGRQDHK